MGNNADADWQVAYDNAAERLFPDCVDAATGKPTRNLTWDEACTAEANATMDNQ
jgi:hypothetical protein